MTNGPVSSELSDDLRRQLRVVRQLDLADKARLLTGETTFTLPGDERIGLAPLALSDGPTGVRGLKFKGGEPVALVPNATLISGSWDDEIAEEVGEMLSEEAHRQGIHVVLGPTINLHRSPLGGRLFEAYSEDPYLTGRTASAYVRGMQRRRTAACLKHLIANESETLRNFMDSRVSERALREVYLLPFEMAVADAHAWSMMAAYNDINGVSATEHRQIQQNLVKREWGWDGLIMSDWFAVKRTVASANGGLDLVMPGPEGPWGGRLVAAVRRGEVAESTVDEHVARLLLLAERTGCLASGDRPVQAAAGSFPAPDSAQRREQLRRIATRGMVLVKNEGGVLPLTPTESLALVGRHALDTQGMGGGSAQVNPPHLATVAHALRARYGTHVTHVDGVGVRIRPVAASPDFVTDPVTDEPGIRVTYLTADGTELLNRHEDGTAITLGWDEEYTEPPASVVFTARLHNHPGPLRLGGIGAGTWTISADTDTLGRRELAITGFDPGEAMFRQPTYIETFHLPADAVVAVRVDLASVDWAAMLARHPALKLAEESHLLATGSFGSVALAAEQDAQTDDQALAHAHQAAETASTAIVVVGLTDEDETEAVDKTTLALPGQQDELVQRVAEAAQRTVVVVNAATPVLMPWLADVDAVLIAGLPGQEAGEAIAAALTGEAEPTGRLVTSYPQTDGAAPAWTVTPDDQLAVHYAEGTFIGYRGFDRGLAPAPLFWFGHGLGYGTWEYRGARIIASEDAAAPIVEIDLANTSSRESRETVQVYFLPSDPAEPIRLVGYAGALVPARQTTKVRVDCDARLFRRWDGAQHAWTRLHTGELVIARGLGDIRARLPIA